MFKGGPNVVKLPERIVGIDCNPIPAGEHDGLCLTVVCPCVPAMDTQPIIPNKFEWKALQNSGVIESILEAGPCLQLL